MRVMITGASGFVGRWATQSLSEMGAEIHALSRHGSSQSSKWMTHQGDLLEAGTASRIVKAVRPDVILHLAWNVEHGKFWSSENNLDWQNSTLELARAASEVGIRRFVGVGTCFEYGWPEFADCDETATPLTPTSLYAVTKDSTRRILEDMKKFSFAWARLFYLYGPFEHEGRLVASLASKLARNQPALLSRGLAVRDFMDARDAGAALAALTMSEVTGAVNIASGSKVSVAEIANLLGEISGKPHLLHIGAMPDRIGEPPRIVANVRRMREEVGFKSLISLDQGLVETYDWWLRQVRSV